MSEFFTWGLLLTIAGATAATAYITQFLKKFDCIKKLNSQAVSYVVALVILSLATYFTGGLTLSTGVMIFFNAIIVAFSSNGAYDSLSSTLTKFISSFGSNTGSGMLSPYKSAGAAAEATESESNVKLDSTTKTESTADTTTQTIVDSQETTGDIPKAL